MKRLGKALITVGVVLVILAMILTAVGFWFVCRPWPKVKGDISVPGISAPAEITRDKWGVPHIYAQNEHDLFFAQGFVHAQDRLWQMEFNRRIASGTLSAILGEATRAAVEDLVAQLINQSGKIEATAFSINGLVADATGGEVVINVGKSSGVAVGRVFHSSCNRY